MITPLLGYVSFETAHCTMDYPYGFTLRCQRREWLDYRKGHGYRFVTCTTNPKKTPKRLVCVVCNGTGTFNTGHLTRIACADCAGEGHTESHYWNKPKAGIYAALGVMFLDDQHHVQWDGLHMYAGKDKIDAFVAQYGACLTGAQEQTILNVMYAVAAEMEKRRYVSRVVEA